MPKEDTGEAIPLVSDTRTSDDYSAFLKILDEKHPKVDYYEKLAHAQYIINSDENDIKKNNGNIFCFFQWRNR